MTTAAIEFPAPKPAPNPRGAGPTDISVIASFLKPIAHLLDDEDVTEIMGNQDGSWFYESKRFKTIQRAHIHYAQEDLLTAMTVIANMLGKPFTDKSPILNAQLPDGSRLAATRPPITKPGLTVTIRKFPTQRYTMEDLISYGSLTSDLAEVIKGHVIAGGTFLISGSTGSGKTTLLNAMTDYIPDTERILIIEDTRELQIDKPNIVNMECQNDTYTKEARVTFDDLLKHALRMRPDRIVLGEVRSNEARTLLDSFNTGHGGSIATIHATSAVLALSRLAELAMRGHQQSNKDDISQEIAASVQYVIQAKRTSAGRRVTEMIHVTGYDRANNCFLFDDVFRLRKEEAQQH
jgi:pilus assembly protein CpaF